MIVLSENQRSHHTILSSTLSKRRNERSQLDEIMSILPILESEAGAFQIGVCISCHVMELIAFWRCISISLQYLLRHHIYIYNERFKSAKTKSRFLKYINEKVELYLFAIQLSLKEKLASYVLSMSV